MIDILPLSQVSQPTGNNASVISLRIIHPHHINPQPGTFSSGVAWP